MTMMTSPPKNGGSFVHRNRSLLTFFSFFFSFFFFFFFFLLSQTSTYSTTKRKSLLGDGMNGLSQVVDIAGGDTSNRDAAILGEVDVVILDELVNLGGGETSVTEHSNLVSHVVPVLLAAKLFQTGTELLPHADDAVSHHLDLLIPLGAELRGGQHGGGKPGTVGRGVGVHGANNDLDLGVNTGGLISRVTHE